jgi:hypothetical protein
MALATSLAAPPCPLSGVKRTWRLRYEMSANDPKRTLFDVEQPELAITTSPFSVLA